MAMMMTKMMTTMVIIITEIVGRFKIFVNYTGKYRGAAHSICNLRYKTHKEIPVALHKRSNYDQITISS